MPFLAQKPLPDMVERLLFSTDVRRAYSAEMREARREPRTELSYTYRMSDAEFAAAEELLRANLDQDWDVPLWHERTRNLSLSISQTAVTCSTDADWRTDSSALIWKGCNEYETDTVAAVGSGSITLTNGPVAAYTNAAIMPVHQGFITGISVGRGLRGYMDIAVTYQLRQQPNLGATAWEVYDTYEVMSCASGYLSRLSGAIIPAIEYVDSGLGKVTLEPFRSTEDYNFAVEVSGQGWKVKQLLHQVRGGDSPFWVKSWGSALTVQAASSGAGTVTVNEARAASDLTNRHISIDGQLRQILSVVDNGATHTLTLDSNLSADVAAGAPTSLLSLVRCIADDIEIQHRHGFNSRVSIPVQETTV